MNKFKVLEDEQFLGLIKENKLLSTSKITRILVRNTLDHYNEEPIYFTYDKDIGCSKATEFYNKHEKNLYVLIKSYKGFFGLDITKNVMITIEYHEVISGKQTITYIV